MAAALVASAALGAPFGLALQEFYVVVKDAVKEACMFKDRLESLQSKLETLNEWVKQIRDLNVVVGHKEEETKNFDNLMREGKVLVEEYLKIGRFDLMKPTYGSKFSELEDDIQRFIDFFVPLFQARNGLANLAISNDIQTTVNKIYEGQNLGLTTGRLSCVVPPPPNFTVGLDVHVAELKRKLLNEKMPLLVVTAPGGRGKTTLVKKLCQDEEIKGLFEENIFFVLVSETPNLKVIARDLLSRKGHEVPQFQSDEDAVNKVGALFKEIGKPMLLIMDDVWSKSEYLISKFKFDISNYYILVTSRMTIGGCESAYKLPILNDEDAKRLLCHSAGLKDGGVSVPDEDIETVLRACEGYPLALEVIGRSLCGKSAESWKNWVVKRSQGYSTFGSSGGELLECLQKSLHVLDHQVKECFLDLGLFPKDKQIPVTTLIAMWTELYNLHEGGTEAIEILDKISSQNLASLDRDREYVTHIHPDYNKDFVSQHDLLKELAIHQSSQGPIEQRKRLIVDTRKETIRNCLSKHKSLPIKAQILSITTDENSSSIWCNIKPSEVEVLVLNFQTENSISLEFLPEMRKVKVLIVTNYAFSCVELTNFQPSGFAPGLRKIILKNVSVPSLNVSVPSLYVSKTRGASWNCPNLVDINIDSYNNLVEFPAKLCEITCLKELSIFRCKFSTLHQRFGELKNLEVLKLRFCFSLWTLPESITSLQNLSILDLYCCSGVVELPEHIGDLKNLEVLRLGLCTDLSSLPKSITSLTKLILLDVSYCFDITFSEHIGKLCNLKVLHVQGCGPLKDKHLPPSISDLLVLVTCDKEQAEFWEPVKKELTKLRVKVIEDEMLLQIAFVAAKLQAVVAAGKIKDASNKSVDM